MDDCLLWNEAGSRMFDKEISFIFHFDFVSDGITTLKLFPFDSSPHRDLVITWQPDIPGLECISTANAVRIGNERKQMTRIDWSTIHLPKKSSEMSNRVHHHFAGWRCESMKSYPIEPIRHSEQRRSVSSKQKPKQILFHVRHDLICQLPHVEHNKNSCIQSVFCVSIRVGPKRIKIVYCKFSTSHSTVGNLDAMQRVALNAHRNNQRSLCIRHKTITAKPFRTSDYIDL